MHEGQGESMETGRNLRDSVGLQISDVVKHVPQELRSHTPSVVSLRARHGRAMAASEKREAHETAEPVDEHTREALTIPSRTDAPVSEVWPQLQSLTRPKSARIAIKAKGRILLIDPVDVIAVEAQGNYVLVQHASKSHMLRESMSTMEEKLNPHGFVRIHRSVLVNAALVEEIQPWSTGEYVLRVRGGKEYTVTRTYKKNLQLLAQSWIGTDGFAAG